MTPQRLRSLFIRERARFSAVYPKAASARLFIVDEPPATYRDYARAVVGRNSRSIIFLRRSLWLPERNIVALIRHELGHCVDSSSASGAEQRADDIAEFVTGKKIRYDTYNLQTTGKGRYPRPLHLHQ